MTKADYAAHFRSEVTKSGRCFFCGGEARNFELDACHLIRAQRIERKFASLPDSERWAIIYDSRLGVPGHNRFAKTDCHGNSHHSPTYRTVYLEDLPPAAIKAAQEYGLNLSRDYPMKEAA